MPDVSNPPGLTESGDVDHQETTNRTHAGDDLSPATLEADSATVNGTTTTDALEANKIILPTASEGDTVSETGVIAYDSTNGQLLVSK